MSGYLTSLLSSSALFAEHAHVAAGECDGERWCAPGLPIPSPHLPGREQDQTQEIAATAKEPQVQRAIQAFTKAVQSATTPQQLLANPQALNVLLTANGLGDQVSYTALATKTLLSNANDSNALVNQLSDTRWKSVVQTYDFANKGLSIIQNPERHPDHHQRLCGNHLAPVAGRHHAGSFQRPDLPR